MGKYHCPGVFFIATFSAYVIFNLWIYGLPQNTNLFLKRKGSPWPSTTNKKSSEAVEVFLQDADTFLSYVHPYNSSIVGKMKFKLKGRALETGKELIEDLVREYKRKPVEMESADVLPKLIPVSAISSNHFKELMTHVTPAEKILPHRKMIVYDLGLSQQEIDHLDHLNRTPHIEYRKFNFSRFPEYVKDLHTYAFKPLIIAEMLAQFGGVLWMDASVIFVRNYSYEFLLQRMVQQRSAFLFYLSEARKHHSILFATLKHMFDYLPMKGEKEKKANMPQATGMMLFNTKHVIKHVMKWVILCSLIEDCIAPKGSGLKCDFSLPDRYNRFGGCHRYDQSLFSIVVSNAYNDQQHMYRLDTGEYPARVRKRM